MGSKSAQNLSLMPNLLSDYVAYKLNLLILDFFFAIQTGILRAAEPRALGAQDPRVRQRGATRQLSSDSSPVAPTNIGD